MERLKKIIAETADYFCVLVSRDDAMVSLFGCALGGKWIILVYEEIF
jgi:hypothetical protein